MLAEIAASGQPAVTGPLADEVETEFGGFGEFLREAQRRWYRTFDARLDALLEDRPPDMRAAVIRLWRALADDMPEVRMLLDAHAGDPALAEFDEHHRRTLRAATGVSLDLTPASAPRRIPIHFTSTARAGRQEA
ncbi:hypothetical protein [Nonomuraea sp. NPDC049784]|uniref:hypothetical protein n=1 Tax=Nonomuraea sp. NPDC049784 TaxID=3154361 RepID=UPI00341140D2